MNEQQFKEKTKRLGLDVIKLTQSLSSSREADPIIRQVVRSSTGVGANYRAACRGRSSADVIAKLGVVEEEADETLYWLEVLSESGIAKPASLQTIMSDTNEILSMTVASIKTLRGRSSDGFPGIKVLQSKIQNPKSKIP